jgi:hypothetical protein
VSRNLNTITVSKKDVPTHFNTLIAHTVLLFLCLNFIMSRNYILFFFQYIKHRLQKTKEGSRQNGGKQSPVPGNHQALSSTAPASLQGLRASKPQGIPNHIPKSNSLSRYQRNSVEGLNTVSLFLYSYI